FTYISEGNYSQAEPLFHGNPEELSAFLDLGENESVELNWEEICRILWCIPVAQITDVEKVSEDELVFYTVFVYENTRRFEIGACCGADPASNLPVWQFAFPVSRVDGEWKVMRLPLYTP
ncbi:MAG: hypothetical protein GWO08_10630, partial [Gammaproteobacteria bacterium]|nr:hypothetical protein [candidate division Zixibacteria bacterium]NIR94103.1 hypothetical protein [Gammaproteobacteria bacterium]NIT59205.1 hypothetical protein [Fodinibius sp.]NIR65668.1 hypothetical protein [candidate division Zixibacteria bacterium]NIS47365.1 hypothetical protein [candidate division Zixibacteria bacterium]